MDLAGRVGRTPGVLVATLAIATALGQTVHVGPGASEASFRVKEPYGIITLFRVTVPHGAVVKVEGRLRRIAGVTLSTSARDRTLWYPSLSCSQRGAADVCVQREEWCPMPQGTWRFHVAKSSGPAGVVRIEFVVGQPPA